MCDGAKLKIWLPFVTFICIEVSLFYLYVFNSNTMKIISRVLLLLAIPTCFFGQADNKFDLELSTGTIKLSANFAQVKSTQPAKSEYFQGYYYRYIQFNELPSTEEKEKLASNNIKILMYLPNNTFVASIKKGTNLNSINSPAIRSLHPIKGQFKMLRELQEALGANNFPSFAVKGNKIGIGFTYFENATHEQVKAYIKSKGYLITLEDKNARWFVVWMKKDKISGFVEQPFVASAELVDDEPKPDNNVGRTNIRSNALATDYSGGRKYNGQGVTVALQDDGTIGPHIDYQGRIPTQFPTNNTGDHGDHCGGTIMGAGNKDPLMRGMAWGANMYVYSATGYQAFGQINTHYGTLGIRIISTSYSDGCNAGYTTRAQQLDIQTLNMPDLLHVFSAGNDGTSNCNYGAGSGWGNVTGGHKHSKNSIAVANLNYLDVRNTSSSRGPAHDGRLKPEVSAVGTDVMSTTNPNNYVPKTGTSMSCPAVAGIFAQLYQAYKNINGGTNPPSALMKAIVMNTADDLGNPGPDFSHGYGRVNGLKAAQIIEQGAYLTNTISNGATNNHTIVVPAGVRRIKVMTYWHDYQAQVGAAVALVNNLNTTLTNPSSAIFNPLILNYAPNSTSLNANAVQGVDIRNNHEQITITNPAAGTYTLNVNGASVPMGPQSYFVTWLFEMDGYTITYPIGGEGFNPSETETIRWDAYETSGNQTLQYTTNNGATWTNISTSIAGAQRYFNWTPPSVISGQCRVKISRGVYSAESDTNFSIIAPPSNLQVAWVCPDSVKLTWNQVPNATSYDVFKLGTMYMDSIKTTTTNSCVITNIPLNQTHWFSVRSRGALNAVSRRAIAVEKTPGLFACPQLAVDVSSKKLISPAGTFRDCHDLSNMPVVIELSNPGLTTLTNVPVFYRINGGAIISDTYAATLSPSATVSYTFSSNANLSSLGTYTIKAWAKYNSDPIQTNDTVIGRVQVIAGNVKSLPLVEDFETFSQCNVSNNCQTICNLMNDFVNESNSISDQHDWRTNSGAPPTSGTGPQLDFSPGSVNGKYVYLESTGPCTSLTAHMLSPCVNLATMPESILSFGYHMNGITMGTMYLDVFANGVWNNAVWSSSGDLGDIWNTANVNLNPWSNTVVTFRWRGTTGIGGFSDMAVDAIYIGSTVGLKEIQQQQHFGVYPNPTNGEFNVRVPSSFNEDLNYVVTDLSGRVILEGKADLKTENNTAKINLNAYAAGVYMLKLKCGDKIEYTKLYKN